MSATEECMVCPGGWGECILLKFWCPEHRICDACLRTAVELAVQDESHYPLSCGSTICSPINDHDVEMELSIGGDDDLRRLKRFCDKTEVYNIPPVCRMYCASPKCCTIQGHSRFINPEVLGEETAVICPDCDSITCRLCRNLIESEIEHACKADDLDAVVLAYIDTLPSSEHWLWQKCYCCGSWVNKTEACNHITCRCKAQFCLICGSKWEEGCASCRRGCPHYASPIYDEDGYSQFGFHKDTGLDREGNTHDPSWDLEGDTA